MLLSVLCGIRNCDQFNRLASLIVTNKITNRQTNKHIKINRSSAVGLAMTSVMNLVRKREETLSITVHVDCHPAHNEETLSITRHVDCHPAHNEETLSITRHVDCHPTHNEETMSITIV